VYGATPPVAVKICPPAFIIVGCCGTIVIPNDGPKSAAPPLSMSSVQDRIKVADKKQNNHVLHLFMIKKFRFIFLF
jgi:hypothetical protein